jgi:DNA uptake protein ComE-like DNA-binding protein
MLHTQTQAPSVLSALLLVAGMTLTAQAKPELPPGHPTFTVKPKAETAKPKTKAEVAKAMSAKAAVQAQRVDINSASKEELKKIPGIDDAIAAKIVAGRPFLTKSRLVSSKIMTMADFQAIRKQIVARQKPGK